MRLRYAAVASLIGLALTQSTLYDDDKLLDDVPGIEEIRRAEFFDGSPLMWPAPSTPAPPSPINSLPSSSDSSPPGPLGGPAATTPSAAIPSSANPTPSDLLAVTSTPSPSPPPESGTTNSFVNLHGPQTSVATRVSRESELILSETTTGPIQFTSLTTVSSAFSGSTSVSNPPTSGADPANSSGGSGASADQAASAQVSNGTSDSVKIGLGVGLGLGIPLVILAAVGAFMLVRRRREYTPIERNGGVKGEDSTYKGCVEAGASLRRTEQSKLTLPLAGNNQDVYESKAWDQEDHQYQSDSAHSRYGASPYRTAEPRPAPRGPAPSAATTARPSNRVSRQALPALAVGGGAMGAAAGAMVEEGPSPPVSPVSAMSRMSSVSSLGRGKSNASRVSRTTSIG